MTEYRSLCYYGGKRGWGKAEWIAGLLPWERKSCYIEPFAGMAECAAFPATGQG